MSKNRKLETPVTLFAAIEHEQHEALRSIAFSMRKSIADVVREALAAYINRRRVSRSRKDRKLPVARRS